MTNENNLKIRGYAIAIHGKMVEDAKTDKDGIITWSGSVAEIFRQLKISQGYYSPIMNLLQHMDCLRQEKRGTKNVNSVYVLLRSPGTIPEAEWPSISSIVKSSRRGLTNEQPGYRLLEEEIRNLAERIPPGLDLARALVELQEQLDKQSQKIEKLERLLNAKVEN
jgi:hypothetical protein